MKKRLLSALLALALVFVLLPTTALAAGGRQGRTMISPSTEKAGSLRRTLQFTFMDTILQTTFLAPQRITNGQLIAT